MHIDLNTCTKEEIIAAINFDSDCKDYFSTTDLETATLQQLKDKFETFMSLYSEW